jgi:hypothetical protein
VDDRVRPDSTRIGWALTLAWGCPVIDCGFHPPTETLTAPTAAETSAAIACRNALIAKHATEHAADEWLRTVRVLQERLEDDE